MTLPTDTKAEQSRRLIDMLGMESKQGKGDPMSPRSKKYVGRFLPFLECYNYTAPEVRRLCAKFNFNDEDITLAISNISEERAGHVDDEWGVKKSKKDIKVEKEKKEAQEREAARREAIAQKKKERREQEKKWAKEESNGKSTRPVAADTGLKATVLMANDPSYKIKKDEKKPAKKNEKDAKKNDKDTKKPAEKKQQQPVVKKDDGWQEYDESKWNAQQADEQYDFFSKFL